MNILCEYRCTHSCGLGYHSSGDSCTANQCACLNGDGAEETDCSNDGGSQCASCDAGFELQQQCESESVSFTSGLSDLAGVNIKTSTHIHFSRTVMRCVSRWHFFNTDLSTQDLRTDYIMIIIIQVTQLMVSSRFTNNKIISAHCFSEMT